MVIQVLRISVGQKAQLENRKLITDKNWFFNPVLDEESLWFISVEEQEQVEDKSGIGWIDSLVLVDHNPIITEI